MNDNDSISWEIFVFSVSHILKYNSLHNPTKSCSFSPSPPVFYFPLFLPPCFCPPTQHWINRKWKSLSPVLLFATPWTIQSMEFSRPEYWSGEPCPSPGDLPNPGLLHCSQILYQLSYQGSMLLLLSQFSHVQLCGPLDSSPPGSPVPGILQARTLEWVAISFSNAW